MDHGYDTQSVMYPDGVKQSEGWEPESFWFIVTEKTMKNPVIKVLELDHWYADKGRGQYRKGLQVYAKCQYTNDWFQPQITEKPLWAKD